MRPLALALAFALAGCAQGSALAGRVDGLRQLVERAAEQGAYECAPRELALARAHLDFADVEMVQGNLARAEAHVRIAEPNGRAALRLSPEGRCAEGAAVSRPAIAAAPGDRDGDGRPDAVDQCPDEPEDPDGYEDDDGCAERQDQDGDGLADDVDLCPIEPEDADGVLDLDGCPDPDQDLDGIADAVDRCPSDAEDFDGHEDRDGCPEADNDVDGIADASDRCPAEAGPADQEGCPATTAAAAPPPSIPVPEGRYENVEVTSTGIEIQGQIVFTNNRAWIRRRSLGVLDTVAQALLDFPDITIEIQGHTDSRGPDRQNLRLSQARAQAVRTYLIRQGVARDRLTAAGYGETRPIDDNRTAEGRAANRRVEFVRTDTQADD